MDTAQRGMGVDWETAKELIGRTMALAKSRPEPIQVACGAGTDHCLPQDLTTPEAIVEAYETQLRAIETAEAGDLDGLPRFTANHMNAASITGSIAV